MISGVTTFNLIGGGFVCLILCALSFFLYSASLIADKQKQSWPVTNATIQSSKLKLVTEMKGATTTTPSSVTHVWRVLVTYTYEIGGKQYTGDKITNADPPSKLVSSRKTPYPQWLADVRDQYVPNSQIQIHYDSKHPSNSFIYFTRSSGAQNIALGAGILFLVFAIFLLLVGFRKIV